MKNDPYGYLRKSGAIGVAKKAIAVSGSTRGKGALGSSSESKTGLAKRANIEGNESAMYEKLEKRSLRSLKEGGSEKELRRGHNFSLGDLDPTSHNPFDGGSDSKPKPKKKRSYDYGTNPIAATRQANKTRRQAARASGTKGALKNVRLVNQRNLAAAKETRAMRDDQGLGKADRAAYKSAPIASKAKVRNQPKRMDPNDEGGGGLRTPLSKLSARKGKKNVLRRTGLGSLI